MMIATSTAMNFKTEAQSAKPITANGETVSCETKVSWSRGGMRQRQGHGWKKSSSSKSGVSYVELESQKYHNSARQW